MKHYIDMSSGAMIFIPSFITIGLGIQNLLVGGGGAHRHQGDLISHQRNDCTGNRGMVFCVVHADSDITQQ
jgi:hypothetical protein